MNKNKKTLLAASLLTIFGGVLAIFGGVFLLSNENKDDTPKQAALIYDDGSVGNSGDTEQALLDEKISNILNTFKSYETAPPEEEFVYIINDGNIQNEDIEPTDQILWDVFRKVAVNDELRNSISEMRVFGQTSQDLEGTLAFVEQLSGTEDDWSLGVNYDEIKDAREAVLTFIHEYMHIESLQDSEIVSSNEDSSVANNCKTLLISEGCLEDDSILYKWHQAHWQPNNLTFKENDGEDESYARYMANESLFINDYAATNTLEDFAESFAFWVLSDTSVPQEKQNYMDNDKRLVDIKQQIRASLVK